MKYYSSFIELMKKAAIVAAVVVMLGLTGDSSHPYMMYDTTIYDSISPPYILYIKDSPGLCQYWFYDTDRTIIPLLKHQLNNNQYGNMLIFEKQYRLVHR